MLQSQKAVPGMLCYLHTQGGSSLSRRITEGNWPWFSKSCVPGMLCYGHHFAWNYFRYLIALALLQTISAEIILLYITLSWLPLLLGCTSCCRLHYIAVKIPEGNWILRCITLRLLLKCFPLFCNVTLSGHTVMNYNGSEVPQGQNRQTINLAQKWVKNGLFVIGWKWPTSGSKVGFGAFLFTKSAPKPTLDPLLGHSATNGKPMFDPLFHQPRNHSHHHSGS